MAKKKPRTAVSSLSAPSPAEAYEATYFARKCGLTRDEALKMMREAQSPLSMATSSGGQRKK
ncbi:hypothetical protein ACFX5Q_30795 [Mesorhizobium sp. IMUNJ 23033]|uniref:hypothetical protein n=1 Tax=Mesorhizobium sp. IMUNJ 23033 TaxID=3378039 RepID=UPI00384DF496